MNIEKTELYTIISTDSDKVFHSKITGDYLTNKLYLGCNDSPDNYEEVLISEIEVKTETETENESEEL